MKRAIIFGALLLPVAVVALIVGAKVMPKPDVEKVPVEPMEDQVTHPPSPGPSPTPTPTPREPGE